MVNKTHESRLRIVFILLEQLDSSRLESPFERARWIRVVNQLAEDLFERWRSSSVRKLLDLSVVSDRRHPVGMLQNRHYKVRKKKKNQLQRLNSFSHAQQEEAKKLSRVICSNSNCCLVANSLSTHCKISLNETPKASTHGWCVRSIAAIWQAT